MKFKFLINIVFLVSVSVYTYAQVLPVNRSVDWSLAGYKGIIPDYPTVVDIRNYGGLGDGVSINDVAFVNAVNSLYGNSGVIYFPTGTYLFNSAINLQSNLILRGASADSTILKFEFGAGNSLNAINIIGSATTINTQLISNANKDSSFVVVADVMDFSVGDYVKLSFNDSSLLFSSWAYGSVGQIVKIASITANKLILESPLRLDYDLLKNPTVTKLTMITDVGIECLKINCIDSTAVQTDNIFYNYAAQCWVSGVESFQCNSSHIKISNSTNLSIRDSYFHDAHAYGGGGQGYGVVCQATSGECLIENNIFKQLRHAMLLQSGANANVFGYNYSINPYWTEPLLPSNAAGDMVLHGNYPYANLFEGNIGQNIVIDDSHGENGSYNTFFRNRGELYGIFMNNNPASNNQNFIGNEVTNTGFLLGLYAINGIGHFQYGNNVKRTIYASGTNTLTDTSYYYSATPNFLQSVPNWPSIGLPNTINMGTIPAKERYLATNYSICNSTISTNIIQKNILTPLKIFPNPSNGYIYIQDADIVNNPTQVFIYDFIGRFVGSFMITSSLQFIDLSSFPRGHYMIQAESERKCYLPEKLILQ